MTLALLAPLTRAARTAREARVLLDAGLVPLTRPVEIARSARDVRRLGPLAGPLAIAARRHPDTVGVVDHRGAHTFTALDQQSNALARAFHGMGIGPGAVVGILCRDSTAPILALCAAGKAGAHAVLLNTGFGPQQAADVCAREDVAVLVVDEELASVVESVDRGAPRVVATVKAGDGPSTLDGLIARTSTGPLPLPAQVGRLVMLTSGTTGTPKGAPRQVNSPLSAAQFIDRIPLRGGGVTLLCAPLFHGTGLSQFLLTMAFGSTTVLQRKFDPVATLRALEAHRVTTLVVVPTMLQRILALDEQVVRRYDTSRLRVLFCAGSALPAAVGNRAMELFGDVVYNLYGSTEVAVATVATPQDWRRAPGTVGRCPVGCRYEILDEHDKPITEPFRTGRVFVGSGLSFGGYTGGGHKEIIDGLLASGDVGHRDADGLLFIDGRDDDMIVSGGENVYPAEVEDTLVSHAEVLDAAVLGVPDDEFGSRLHAIVVARDGSTVTEDDLRNHIRHHLARYKVPRTIEFRSTLPRNPTGKLLRRQLSGPGGGQ